MQMVGIPRIGFNGRLYLSNPNIPTIVPEHYYFILHFFFFLLNDFYFALCVFFKILAIDLYIKFFCNFIYLIQRIAIQISKELDELISDCWQSLWKRVNALLTNIFNDLITLLEFSFHFQFSAVFFVDFSVMFSQMNAGNNAKNLWIYLSYFMSHSFSEYCLLRESYEFCCTFGNLFDSVVVNKRIRNH